MAKALREPAESIYSDEDLTNAHAEIDSAQRDLRCTIVDLTDAQERIKEAMSIVEAYYVEAYYAERSAPGQ